MRLALIPPQTQLVVATALACGGLLLAVVVSLSPTPFADEDALVRPVQRLPGWATPVAGGLRAITGTAAVILFTAVLAVLLMLRRHRVRAVFLGLALLVLVVAQAGIKDLVDRPRPSEAYVDVRDGWTSPSFPSGHIMGGTFLFASLAFLPAVQGAPSRVRRTAWTGAGVAIGANAVANLLMGVHWPTDVAAGLLFGGGLALAANVAARRLQTR